LLLGGLNVATTAAATAIAATIAAAVAATMATAVAAITSVATAVAAITSVATAMAAVTAVAAIATIAAVTTEDKGRSLVLTAHQGDTDDREENRETKNNNTVHPHSSNYLQVP
jgi:hypothetical protein